MTARSNWRTGKKEQEKGLTQEMQGVISKFLSSRKKTKCWDSGLRVEGVRRACNLYKRTHTCVDEKYCILLTKQWKLLLKLAHFI